MSSTKTLSVRSEHCSERSSWQLLRGGNLSRLTLWWVSADLLFGRRLLHQAQKAWCTRRKKRQALRRSRDTGMRSAQSGDCVLPPAGARRCNANHRGIEGEAMIGTMCTCEEIQKGTHAHKASKLGPVERQWTQNGKLPRPFPRVWKMDTFIVWYLFVLHSMTSRCLKTCHFTACWTSLYLFLFSMLILHVTSSRFCLYLLNIYHFTYTFSYAHTEAHTHKHACIISTQEEWRQPDSGAWLRGAKERLLLVTKALSTQKEQKGQNMSEKIDVHESKEKIQAHRASSKATRLFLTK